MTEYISDPIAHLRSSDLVIEALSNRDANGLASALEDSDGTIDHDALVLLAAAIERSHPRVELVKAVGRGGPNPTLADLQAKLAANGPSMEAFRALIDGLRDASIIIRKMPRRGAIGPPRGVLDPDTDAGLRISIIQEKLGISFDEAAYAWILECRNGRKLQSQTEVRTWDRKLRRAKAAWAEFLSQIREMDN